MISGKASPYDDLIYTWRKSGFAWTELSKQRTLRFCAVDGRTELDGDGMAEERVEAGGPDAVVSPPNCTK